MIMASIRNSIIIAVAAIVVFAGCLLPLPASAAGVFQGCGANPDSAVCKASTTDTSQQAQSMVGTIINIILFIVGILSVIMIVVGGIRYTLSGGDASATQSAKNTIMYAVVGLVISMLAFAIVNFVVAQFSK